MEIQPTAAVGLIPQEQRNWQGRPEWFFNREHTDTYEQWYEGPTNEHKYLIKN